MYEKLCRRWFGVLKQKVLRFRPLCLDSYSESEICDDLILTIPGDIQIIHSLRWKKSIMFPLTRSDILLAHFEHIRRVRCFHIRWQQQVLRIADDNQH